MLLEVLCAPQRHLPCRGSVLCGPSGVCRDQDVLFHAWCHLCCFSWMHGLYFLLLLLLWGAAILTGIYGSAFSKSVFSVCVCSFCTQLLVSIAKCMLIPWSWLKLTIREVLLPVPYEGHWFDIILTSCKLAYISDIVRERISKVQATSLSYEPGSSSILLSHQPKAGWSLFVE